LRNNGFDWWLRRIQTQLQLFDILRIDHFRGLEAAWEIPVTEDTAINGEWVKAPGQLLLNKIHQHFGYIALVAEDLGVITPEVEALRDDFSLPGMKVLQFGFSNDPHNPHEPHNCSRHSVIYTGTHDNDTTLGWYQQLNERQRYSVDNYLSNPGIEMPDALINCALASVARMAILPLQDVLGLDGEHRMNVPGTTEGNWSWRFSWDQISEQRIENLREKVVLYGRL
jgi:4-alpha-glucanotransferase